VETREQQFTCVSAEVADETRGKDKGYPCECFCDTIAQLRLHGENQAAITIHERARGSIPLSECLFLGVNVRYLMFF